MLMRKNFIAVVVLFAVCTASAHARLGETQDELTVRFGKPIVSFTDFNPDRSGRIPTLLFSQGGFTITCDIMNGHCTQERYGPAASARLDWIDSTGKPTPKLLEMLQVNGAGQTWKQTSVPDPLLGVYNQTYIWTRSDGTTAMTGGEDLTFTTPEFIAERKRIQDAFAAAMAYKAAHPGTSTNGF